MSIDKQRIAVPAISRMLRRFPTKSRYALSFASRSGKRSRYEGCTVM
jgi:hypothetical protein